MSGENFLDFVQRLATQIRGLEKLVFSTLDEIADVVDIFGLEAVGGTNRKLEIATGRSRIGSSGGRNIFVLIGHNFIGSLS